MNRKQTTTALLAAACVSLGAAAPFALADQPEGVPFGAKSAATVTDTTTTGTTTGAAAEPTKAEKRQGYGVLCKGQLKVHVKGEKGTAFSRCVTALAKIDRGETTSAKQACKTFSKKHVKGKKGTPYSLCVKAAKKQIEKTQQAS